MNGLSIANGVISRLNNPAFDVPKVLLNAHDKWTESSKVFQKCKRRNTLAHGIVRAHIFQTFKISNGTHFNAVREANSSITI